MDQSFILWSQPKWTERSATLRVTTSVNLVQHVAEDRVTEIGAPTSQENFIKRYKKPWDPKMTLLVDFDVPRSKTRHSKPRDWEERVAKENELALKVANIKSEPEDEKKSDMEVACSSKLNVKRTKRVFKDENVQEEVDSLFDSEEDFETEKPKAKPKKRKSSHSPTKDPPMKKSKTSAKAKAKGSSISRQIVK